MSLLHRSRHRAPRRLRRYVLIAIGSGLAATIGVASAQWFSVPDGPGNGYGKGGHPATGVAVTSIALADGDARLGTPFSAGDSGFMQVAVHNSNTQPVDVTQVAVPAGSVITKVSDPACTAPASTFTITAWTGSVKIGGNADGPLSGSTPSSFPLPITTTSAFPICLADSVFSIPVTISAVQHTGP